MAINIDVNVDAKKAQREVSSFTDTAKRQFTALGSVITGVSVVAIGAFVKKTIDATDKIGKLSIRLGESTEFLSEMGFVAERSGVRIEAMQVGIQRANRRIAEFAMLNRGVAAGAIKRLGLQVKNADGSVKSFEQILPELADSLNKVSDSGEKVRLAFQLFDTEGVSFIQILNEGSSGIEKLRTRAQALGKTISGEMAKDAADAADAILDLETAFGGLSREISISAAPSITSFITRLTDTIAAIRGEKGLVETLKSAFGVSLVRGQIVFNEELKKAIKANEKAADKVALQRAEQEKLVKLVQSTEAAQKSVLAAKSEGLRLELEVEKAKKRSEELDREMAELDPELIDAQRQITEEKQEQFRIALKNNEIALAEADAAEMKRIADERDAQALEVQREKHQQILSAITPFTSQLAEAVGHANRLRDTLEDIAKTLAKRVFAGLLTGGIGQLFGVPFTAGFRAGSGFASGGSFTIPGASSSFDTKTVSFKGRPGEQVFVLPKGKSLSNGATYNINISGQNIDRNFVANELIPMLRREEKRIAYA